MASWIEIKDAVSVFPKAFVEAYVASWIEIDSRIIHNSSNTSRLMWPRGLKCLVPCTVSGKLYRRGLCGLVD